MEKEILKPLQTEGRAEWFDGDLNGLEIFRLLVDLLHIWDDLVDKDKPVSESQINRAFLNCLVFLPCNALYQKIQLQIAPLWVCIVSAYETANQFEQIGESHGVEIAHTLRYSAGHIIAYAMVISSGMEHAKKHLPDMWKAVVFERFEPYQKEHQK